MKVDIIIPVYKPDDTFFELIDKLEQQTLPVRKIIIMNTEEKYFEKLIYGKRFKENYHNIDIYHLSKKEFDHGRTRNKGVKKSEADFFIMMTQDAIPADHELVEQLIRALEQPDVAAAYARQLPKADCDVIESCTRYFNYPEQSLMKSEEDLGKLGIKTYFCSNVCCAYRRDVFDKLGGFVNHAIFNEDMVYAAEVIRQGYKIAYVAEAKVYHSHNYTFSQYFCRNFDNGVSQACHPEVFANLPSEGEGIRSVKATMSHLRSRKKRKLIPKLIVQSGCKYVGFFLGKHYRHLPKKMVLSCSMNKDYWKHEERKRDVANIDATKGYGRTEAEKQ